MVVPPCEITPSLFSSHTHLTILCCNSYKSKGGLKGADFNKRSKGGAGRGLVQRSIDYARKTTLVGLSPSSRKKGQGQDDQALSPPDPNVLHEATLNPLHGLPIKALALLSSKPSSKEGSDSSSTERSDGSRPTLFNWLEAIEQIHWPTSSFFLARAKRSVKPSSPNLLHSPPSMTHIDTCRTLALTELTLSQLSLLYCRYRHRPHMHALTDHHSGGSQPVTIQGEGVGLTPGHRIDRGGVDEAILQLPFKLTRAQKVALEEVLSDMEGKGGSDGDDRPMQRLLQGDVGSGKTIVALLAMIAVAGTGRSLPSFSPSLSKIPAPLNLSLYLTSSLLQGAKQYCSLPRASSLSSTTQSSSSSSPPSLPPSLKS